MTSRIPLLMVTNPIFLDLYERGVEDPEWGNRPVQQQAIAASIFEMAKLVNSPENRRQIQEIAVNLMGTAVQDIRNEMNL